MQRECQTAVLKFEAVAPARLWLATPFAGGFGFARQCDAHSRFVATG
jgi:hypothetical protein